ncbi:MAG TPA: rhomboid family intramembrane serine protease [Bacteroidia bacterium]|jgi:membrane associated rhomboid family serine protease|nr:rhomboid family intramembrane serine protease [Bacteroidia bacterium]
MSIIRDIQNSMRGTYGALFRLIIINVSVFLFLNIVISILVLKGSMVEYAGEDVASLTDLPGDIHKFPSHFWTLFTYMFVHYSLPHIFSNMLIFYFLGRIFSDYLGGARLTAVYLIGGIVGGIIFMAFWNIVFPGRQAHLDGASAAVMAVVVAVGAYAPDNIVFFFRWPVKLKWVALISFVLTTLIDLADNSGGKFAHIGGAAFGFLYGAQLRGGIKFLEGFSSLFRFRKNKKMRVEYSRSKKANDELYNTSKASVRKRVDEILDKISRSGYDSLSSEEKDFLRKNHDKL